MGNIVTEIVISGTGVFTPTDSVSNEELVASFNSYVDRFNKEHAEGIEAGTITAMEYSDADFIEKASGIKSRYVMDKKNVLDNDVMTPMIARRENEELSIIAEMSLPACKQALENANKKASDVDGVIMASSGSQRPYPATAVEIQEELGIEGFGFDMNIACSSATFAINIAADMVRSGTANAVLVAVPEFCSAQINFYDRDSHFIFGDVAVAILVERKDSSTSDDNFEIVSTKLKTKYSNNIRSNFGMFDRANPPSPDDRDKQFSQNGRKVFREVSPMVADIMLEHLNEESLASADMKRLWLHQANIHMNDFINRKVLGREPVNDEAPIILDRYANTAAAGSIIAFHEYRDDFSEGEMGVICSFGAGYSIGSLIVKKV
jgi:beta-ketodecanoyl-[acyl-carrier-protein] synthase